MDAKLNFGTAADRPAVPAGAPVEGGVGTVWLVGAGPGDPGLLTRKGAAAIERADVIVYDRLVNPEILGLARPGAEVVYAGKAPGDHCLGQEAINRLLEAAARSGKTVCRLKGGDPFVFGRGGEEAVWLRERGIPVEVVPGVSSAIAVPAAAGIPVTDRRCASSFAVFTGHPGADGEPRAMDWGAVARSADTLVFLMGLGALETIARELAAHGVPADRPAAVIQEGTTARQRVVAGKLDEIAGMVLAAELHSPAVIVVGEVVRLREVICGAAGEGEIVARAAAIRTDGDGRKGFTRE